MTTELDRSLHASVLKREAEKERRYREEQAQRDEETMLGFGGTDMSKEELRKVIDSDRRMYYRTVELNDKLYIHYKGWKRLQNLDGWTGLRALYAECNAFDRITGLQNCRSLRSLFLQENCIRRIEGLDNCPDLWNLNLSSNFIESLDGIGKLVKLNTLVIAKNKVGINGLDDLVDLVGHQLNSLDIQDNKIADVDVLPEVLVQMPDLRVLYLKGNPCAKKIPNYRKSTTAYCKELRYLDDRPVFPEDRRAAEAFNRGGLEAERAERRVIRDEKTAAHDRNMRSFQDMIERVKLEKREREDMCLEDKYTVEDDPGLWKEREMKKKREDWERENAEELKDHDLERAKKALEAEKRMQEGGDVAEARADVDVETKAAPEASVVEPPPEEKKPVDNRKLVYEDIWDDLPTPAKPPTPKSPAQSFHSGASASFASSVPDVAGTRGTVGRSVASGGAAPVADDRNAVALANVEASVRLDSGAGAQKETTWYTRYSEKMERGKLQLERGIAEAKKEARENSLAFAPPPRGAVPASVDQPPKGLEASAAKPETSSDSGAAHSRSAAAADALASDARRSEPAVPARQPPWDSELQEMD